MEYPSAHEFYHRSNTHDPDEDRFEDLYCWDFIHAISRVACRKLARHRLDPYQCAAFHCGIVCHNTGEEEADPTLELAMEYASALGTIVFDESCRLHDLMEAQVGRNQFTMDVAVDQLDDKIDEVDGMSWGPAFGRLPLCLSLQPKQPSARYSIWFPSDSNPRPGFSASSGISGWSAGVRVSMGVGHVMAYAAIGLR